jgi:hypothetical protein
VAECRKSWLAHLVEKHGEVPDLKIKQFVTKRNFLSSHMNSLGRGYEEINYDFAYSGSEDASHMLSTSKDLETWVHCNMCHKAFANNVILDIHLKYYHACTIARINQFNRSILTGTSLIKAQVISENEVVLDLNVEEELLETTKRNTVPLVSKVNDACILLQKNLRQQYKEQEQFRNDEYVTNVLPVSEPNTSCNSMNSENTSSGNN